MQPYASRHIAKPSEVLGRRLRACPLPRRAGLLGAAFAAAALARVSPGAEVSADSERTGGELYHWACASCHGTAGQGAPESQVGFDVPLPDFADCSFASREPNADWVAVAHDGGPVRGFSELMPAFRDAMTVEQLESTLDHIRTFCGDEDWPRGELNLPRALVTTKAYPEDEAVVTTSVATEGPAAIGSEFVYERRFGARNQWELAVPLEWHETEAGAPGGDGDWSSGLGDVALGLKRAVWHSLERGGILSLAAEVLLPTGDEDRGFGSGTVLFEPFVAYGQILPAEFFLQAQAGFGLPWDTDRVEEEAFGRLALGRSFSQNRWGRTWSPMVELLADRELTSDADTNWDIVPQLQVTLNTRQHLMANAGLRIPADDDDDRHTTAIVYFLWDWFDGGLTEGW